MTKATRGRAINVPVRTAIALRRPERSPFGRTGAALIACPALGPILLGAPAGAGTRAVVDPTPPAYATPPIDSAPPLRLAAADDDESEGGKLQPRYEPREPVPEPWYNASYLFGMTRGVADSTMHPAAKVPLFVLTVPLDIVFLPFAAIGGLFG